MPMHAFGAGILGAGFDELAHAWQRESIPSMAGPIIHCRRQDWHLLNGPTLPATGLGPPQSDHQAAGVKYAL